jgi:hypothetical protein
MKYLKNIFVVTIILLFVACNTSEEDNDNPTIHNVVGTINTSALLSLTGNDATALVTLNGEPAGTFTSEASIGDEVFYEIKTTSPSVEIVIINFFYTSGDQELWETGIERIIDTGSSPTTASLKVLSGIVGNEVKFGFTFALKTNGVLDANTTYIVDPKLRVRS